MAIVMCTGGNDSFTGTSATDSNNGSSSFDLLSFAKSPSAFTSFGSGTLRDGYGNTSTLLRIEEIQGSAFDSVFTGTAGTCESFKSLARNDAIDRGPGIDTPIYSESSNFYTWTFGATLTVADSSSKFFTAGMANAKSFERLKLSDVSVALDLYGHAGHVATC